MKIHGKIEMYLTYTGANDQILKLLREYTPN